MLEAPNFYDTKMLQFIFTSKTFNFLPFSLSKKLLTVIIPDRSLTKKNYVLNNDRPMVILF